MCLRTVLFVLLVPLVLGLDRKITSKLNPGCQSCDTTLVYIKAVGSHDTIHQIWDFTRGTPTMIFAVGGVDSNLTIDWIGTQPTEFTFSETPQYSFALAFDAIYEYNDIKDEAVYDKLLPHNVYPFDRFHWKLNASSLSDSSKASVQLHSSFINRGTEKNCIDIKLLLLPYRDYGSQLPHLIHTANSTLIDFDMVNFTTYRNYNSSRFALHFLFVSTDGESNTMTIDPRKSLDDEHTPGVFEIIEIESPASERGLGGFVQFRPVAYTRPLRGVETSTVVRTNLLHRAGIPQHSTLHAFYQRFAPKQLLIDEYFISFGDTADGFYKQYNYTSWSFTLGYGAPPVEGFSLFVIMIICFGLGVPIVLAISGVIYVLVTKFRRHNPSRRFTNDE